MFKILPPCSHLTLTAFIRIPQKALGRLRLHPEVIGNASATALQTDSDDGGS